MAPSSTSMAVATPHNSLRGHPREIASHDRGRAGDAARLLYTTGVVLVHYALRACLDIGGYCPVW